MFSHATLLLALSAGVSAHMRLNWPVPYDFPNLDQAPLEPSDFPCKARISSGGYKVTTMNAWNAGETKTISFLGDAVHGGGSCQFSVTTDTKPNAQSQWKVIQSVEGGCPAAVPGNLGGDPNGKNAATFPVTMPKDMASGQYTFAWTWINKVGNREFYMNCAPIQVGGGSSGGASAKAATSALSSLPDMFVANLPATQCATTEGQDFTYPNPGANVIKGSKATPGNTMSINTGCAAQAKLGTGSGQLGTPSAGDSSSPAASGSPSSPQASGSPASGSPASPQPSGNASSPQASGSPSRPGGVFAPGASSAPAAAPATPAAPAAPADQPAPATGGNSSCTPCSTDGAIVCIGSAQFGLCNHGCAIAQALAAGTKCSGGQIMGASRRSLKFPRGHIHRRHGSALL